MNKEENAIVSSLKNLLVKIIDAKEKDNYTEENSKIAIVDTMKLLNRVYSNIVSIKNANVKVIFNNYQQYFFTAINQAKKEIKVPLIEINNNLWRVYLFGLFKSNNQEKVLEELTGWKIENLQNENMTNDMKIIMVSFANI